MAALDSVLSRVLDVLDANYACELAARRVVARGLAPSEGAALLVEAIRPSVERMGREVALAREELRGEGRDLPLALAERAATSLASAQLLALYRADVLRYYAAVARGERVCDGDWSAASTLVLPEYPLEAGARALLAEVTGAACATLQ